MPKEGITIMDRYIDPGTKQAEETQEQPADNTQAADEKATEEKGAGELVD